MMKSNTNVIQKINEFKKTREKTGMYNKVLAQFGVGVVGHNAIKKPHTNRQTYYNALVAKRRAEQNYKRTHDESYSKAMRRSKKIEKKGSSKV